MQFDKHLLSICRVPSIVALGDTEMVELWAMPSEACCPEWKPVNAIQDDSCYDRWGECRCQNMAEDSPVSVNANCDFCSVDSKIIGTGQN